jgi:hypothetical protein
MALESAAVVARTAAATTNVDAAIARMAAGTMGELLDLEDYGMCDSDAVRLATALRENDTVTAVTLLGESAQA